MQTITDFQQVLASPVLAYEEGLNFFEGKGMLNETLSKLVDDLERHGIDYAVIGAVALNQYGYQRFTSDIDLLMTKEGLEKFHRELVGLGYVTKFKSAKKTFREVSRNVQIEVITTGEYPGDGEVKPLSFPDPKEAAVVINGVKTINFAMLLSLKLASGMTNTERQKDLVDVREMIKLKALGLPFLAQLNPYVHEKFLELLNLEMFGQTHFRNLCEEARRTLPPLPEAAGLEGHRVQALEHLKQKVVACCGLHQGFGFREASPLPRSMQLIYEIADMVNFYRVHHQSGFKFYVVESVIDNYLRETTFEDD
jgi:hypothetical protein